VKKRNVLLHRSEDGWSAERLDLPGCHSQGKTRAEAEQNIEIAARDYLAVAGEPARKSKKEKR
jgi:predicted RNase H-like HicB family nuclease